MRSMVAKSQLVTWSSINVQFCWPKIPVKSSSGEAVLIGTRNNFSLDIDTKVLLRSNFDENQ